MEPFIRALARFIARDIPYVIGGLSVIIAVTIFFGISIPADISTPMALFAAGVGYVIGFAIQDGISFTPLINTSVQVRPGKFLINLYRRYTRLEWKEPSGFDPFDTYLRMYSDLPPEKAAPIERIISLKHIGFTMGANWLVCSLMLIGGSVIHNCFNQLVLGVGCLLISGVLLLIGWLQAMQMYVALGWLSTKLPLKESKGMPRGR